MALAEKIQPVETTETTTNYARKRRIQTKPGLKAVLPAMGLVLCLAAGNVIVQGLVVGKNYQIRQWEKRINAQEREMVQLKMDIARLESFDRVQTIAKNELGMKNAGPRDYQLIPPVAADPQVAPNPEYLDAENQNGLLNKIAAWLGEIGKTMANTP